MKQDTSKQHTHERGLALFAALGDLDPELVTEAEIDIASPVSHSGKARENAAATTQLFNIDESPAPKGRTNPRSRRRMWGTVAASLAGLLVIAGIVALIGNVGGLLPGWFGPGKEPADTVTPSLKKDAWEILLPGKVPFAAEAGDFTISVKPMIESSAGGITVTMQSRALGASLSGTDWRLENLTDPTWDGDVAYDLSAWEMDGTDDDYTRYMQRLSFTQSPTPGIYRLHALANQNGELRSVAYCEFAVDDEKGTYKTWTEADILHDPIDEPAYTISTDVQIPYGTAEIAVTFRATKPMTGFTAPTTCRLVKLDGTAGAGACLINENEGLSIGVEIDATPGSNASAARTETYTIINPAACTPGRYRIYNVDENGRARASCEFEIVGEPIGWPGEDTGTDSGETHPFPEAEEKPFTITASIDHYDDGKTGYLSITYKGIAEGEPILHPSLNIRVVKIEGVDNPAEWEMVTTEEAIESVMPTEQNGNYAVFTKSHTITNAEAILPGVYRVYALTYANEYIDYYDVVFGAEDIYPEAEEKPYTIEAEIATSKYAPDRMFLYITYTATEKGVKIHPNLTGIIIHKIYGEADEQGPYTDMNEYGLGVPKPEPDEYCSFGDSRTIYNLEHMKPGVYRIYSLNEGRTAYIDYYDVMWDGYTLSDTKETETFGDETDVYEPLPEPEPEPEEGYVAEFYINGYPVVCGDAEARMKSIPEQDIETMHYEATQSWRVPLFATLRMLDPTLTVTQSDRRIDFVYKGNSYIIEDDGVTGPLPILRDPREDQYSALLGAAPGSVTAYAAYIGDDILVDIDTFATAAKRVLHHSQWEFETDVEERTIRLTVNADVAPLYGPLREPELAQAEQNYPYRVTVTEEDGTLHVHVTGGYNDNWRLECLEGAHAGEVSIPNVAPTGLPPDTTTTVWSTKIYLPEGDDYEGIYYLHNVVKENGEWRSVRGAIFAVGDEYEAWLDYIRVTTGSGQ